MRLLTAILFGLITASPTLNAQIPPSSITIGLGIDTTDKDLKNIIHLTYAYLARPDSSARNKGLWTTTNEFDRRWGDLTIQAYQGLPATIISVTSSEPSDSVYTIKIFYGSGRNGSIPLGIQRLYAIREPGAQYEFKLSGAFSRITRHWERRTSGPLTLWYSPNTKPNKNRISKAAQFVDSVTKIFAIPAPKRLDVIVANSIEEAQRAIGFDYFVNASGPGQGRGGLTLGQHGVVLAGDPRMGEAYFHELTHAILMPHISSVNSVFHEGVATWLGGTQGRSFGEAVEDLRKFQTDHPNVNLHELFGFGTLTGITAVEKSSAYYASVALIAKDIYERSGVMGLRALAALK